MKALSAVVRGIDWFTEKVGFGVSWLSTALVVLVCVNVFTRYVIRSVDMRMQELEWHLFAALFLLGAAYTLKHDKHVRVDLVYARLGRKGKAWIDLLGSLLFLLPFCGIVTWASWSYLENSYAIGEGSPNNGLPARYVLWSCIPLAMALLALQGLSLAGRSLLTILGADPPKPEKEGA